MLRLPRVRKKKQEADISEKKVNLYIQEMKLWDAFKLVLKMFDVTYAKFNKNTYIVLTKDKFINSGYNEEEKKHIFFPVTNVDPKYIIDLIRVQAPFKKRQEIDILKKSNSNRQNKHDDKLGGACHKKNRTVI